MKLTFRWETNAGEYKVGNQPPSKEGSSGGKDDNQILKTRALKGAVLANNQPGGRRREKETGLGRREPPGFSHRGTPKTGGESIKRSEGKNTRQRKTQD